jgi:hypothetical protein
MKSGTNTELQLYLLAVVAAVLYAFFSSGFFALAVLFFPSPFLAICFGVLLLWGLPLWRRLYLGRRTGAPVVLTIVGILFLVVCQRSFFMWLIASGASGMNP